MESYENTPRILPLPGKSPKPWSLILVIPSNPVDPDRDSASRDKSRFLKFEIAVFSQQVYTDVLSPTGRPERF